MMGIKGVLLQWFINILIKKTACGAANKSKNIVNQHLTTGTIKPLIKKN